MNPAECKNWIEVRFEGRPPERRAHHASFIHSNTLYVHGGEDLFQGLLKTMWYLPLSFMTDSQSKPTWIPLITQRSRNAPGALAHHTAIEYCNFAYFIGGVTSDGSSNKEMFRFDIPNKKWVDFPIMSSITPGRRDDHTCVLAEDKMLLFGGF